MNNLFKKSLSIILCLLMAFSVCVCAFAGEEADDGFKPFRIHLTVNGDTKTQKGINWYTSKETDTVVKVFDATGAEVQNVKIEDKDCFEWNGNYCHKALIKGLEAGKTYGYKVGNGTVFSEMGTFVTDNGDDKTEFVAIADIQASNLDNFKKGRATLEAAFDTIPGAEFYINLGDFTNDSDNEEWDYYDEALTSFNLGHTIVPVAGNHDGLGVWHWFENMFNLDTSKSVQTLNGVNYSFDYGNVHIAVVNTNDMASVTIAQLNWLKNDMRSTDKDWKIVCMHKSPYTLGKDGKWPDALYLQRSLTAVCDLCDVDLVLSGHDHQYIRTKSLKMNTVKENNEGTTYVLCGTAGSKRYEIRPFLKGMFLKKNFVEAINIQRDTDWDGTDWDLEKITNKGGEFNTITTDGGTLTFSSYVLQEDEKGVPLEENAVKLVDTFTITKETGKNKVTYNGENKTNSVLYYLGLIPSFFALATYTFGEWLPKFFANIPNLAYIFIKYDIF